MCARATSTLQTADHGSRRWLGRRWRPYQWTNCLWGRVPHLNVSSVSGTPDSEPVAGTSFICCHYHDNSVLNVSSIFNFKFFKFCTRSRSPRRPRGVTGTEHCEQVSGSSQGCQKCPRGIQRVQAWSTERAVLVASAVGGGQRRRAAGRGAYGTDRP